MLRNGTQSLGNLSTRSIAEIRETGEKALEGFFASSTQVDQYKRQIGVLDGVHGALVAELVELRNTVNHDIDAIRTYLSVAKDTNSLTLRQKRAIERFVSDVTDLEQQIAVTQVQLDETEGALADACEQATTNTKNYQKTAQQAVINNYITLAQAPAPVATIPSIPVLKPVIPIQSEAQALQAQLRALQEQQAREAQLARDAQLAKEMALDQAYQAKELAREQERAQKVEELNYRLKRIAKRFYDEKVAPWVLKVEKDRLTAQSLEPRIRELVTASLPSPFTSFANANARFARDKETRDVWVVEFSNEYDEVVHEIRKIGGIPKVDIDPQTYTPPTLQGFTWAPKPI